MPVTGASASRRIATRLERRCSEGVRATTDQVYEGAPNAHTRVTRYGGTMDIVDYASRPTRVAHARYDEPVVLEMEAEAAPGVPDRRRNVGVTL